MSKFRAGDRIKDAHGRMYIWTSYRNAVSLDNGRVDTSNEDFFEMVTPFGGFTVGDSVRSKATGASGKIVEINGNRATVHWAPKITHVNVAHLELASDTYRRAMA